tara:strand:+ start:1520 stop:2671 length:1152 start_codon:yes stop_codon:yes gene_type:complete
MLIIINSMVKKHKTKKKKGGGKDWENMYLEYNEGTSNKFWEITRDKNKITTRWGKQETKGQELTKDYGPKAKEQYKKMIDVKKKKGYKSYWKKGSRSKKFDCKKMNIYQKELSFKISNFKNGKHTVKTRKVKSMKDSMKGIEIDKKSFYKYKGSFNEFESKPTKIPKRYVQTKLTPKQTKLYCGNTKPEKPSHKGKNYFIHDNGGRPFLVVIDNKHVKIFKVPIDNKHLDFSEVKNKQNYSQLIKEYKQVKQIFIGKSHKSSPMAKFSAGFGKKFDGNSILLELSPKKYCYIGSEIYEFSTKDDIQSYDSPVGNNDVPYPLARGDEFFYFMLDAKYVPKDKLKDKVSTDEAWEIFHGECCPWKSVLDPYKKNIKKRQIHKRDF